MSGNRSGQLYEATLKRQWCVRAARTISPRERQLPIFRGEVGRGLGPAGITMKPLGATHLTCMESFGVTNALVDRGYTAKQVIDFAAAMRDCIKQVRGKRRPTVSVDRDEPLVAMGRSNDVLALKIHPDAHLCAQRTAIEEFLRASLDLLPEDITPFVPHMAIGKVGVSALAILRSDPHRLVPKHVRLPGAVAVGPLECYIGEIPHTKM